MNQQAERRDQSQHDTYFTRDIWQAAALDCYGVPFVCARLQPDGRVSWTFDNADDRAFVLGREFRSRDVMMVPILDLRTSYIRMSRAAAAARRDGFSHDEQAA